MCVALGEPDLISARFRHSLSHPLLFGGNRNCQHVKGLPIFRGQFAALPDVVRAYEIQEYAFFNRRLTLEQNVRVVREFECGPTPEWTGAPSSGGFAGSGNAEAQLTAIAKQIAAERRHPFRAGSRRR